MGFTFHKNPIIIIIKENMEINFNMVTIINKSPHKFDCMIFFNLLFGLLF